MNHWNIFLDFVWPYISILVVFKLYFDKTFGLNITKLSMKFKKSKTSLDFWSWLREINNNLMVPSLLNVCCMKQCFPSLVYFDFLVDKTCRWVLSCRSMIFTLHYFVNVFFSSVYSSQTFKGMKNILPKVLTGFSNSLYIKPFIFQQIYSISFFFSKKILMLITQIKALFV